MRAHRRAAHQRLDDRRPTGEVERRNEVIWRGRRPPILGILLKLEDAVGERRRAYAARGRARAASRLQGPGPAKTR